MILPLLASDMLSIPLPNIDWAIQIDTTQGGLLLTSQLSIETNKLGLRKSHNTMKPLRDIKNLGAVLLYKGDYEHERRNFHL